MTLLNNIFFIVEIKENTAEKDYYANDMPHFKIENHIDNI